MRMTPQTWLVVRCFFLEPENQYGLKIANETLLPTGTVYPILDRMVDAGYLTVTREVINEANPDRPPRRLFAITGTGRSWAMSQQETIRRYADLTKLLPNM